MSHSFWWLICDTFAVYRLAILVTQDEIARPFRQWVGKAFGTSSWTSYLITCPWCISMYFAAVAVALTKWWPDGWQYFAAALTFSAVTGILAERTDH